MPPYFGWVKRSMNRKPQAADSWWSSHQASCNGTFEKVSETNGEVSSQKESTDKFKGKGRTWSNTQPDGGKSSKTVKMTEFFTKKKIESPKLNCVNCTNYVTESLRELNEHLDICLTKSPPKKLKFIINLEEDE